jgi:hypothetical protein
MDYRPLKMQRPGATHRTVQHVNPAECLVGKLTHYKSAAYFIQYEHRFSLPV